MQSDIKLFLPEIANGEDKTSPFVNRIRKNYRHLRKWAKRCDTDCFRIYDRDIREYPFAIDFYAGRFCIHYFSRDTDQSKPPAELVVEIELALQTVFGKGCQQIYWKTRAKTKETRQYEKLMETKEFFPVYEYGLKFKVNLQDYLDTGIFLDHRETRRYVASISSGKRVLNLFAYTCSFSVHAAMAGALFTKSVDMSNTYVEWGKDNFILNGLSLKNHPVIRADCLVFLQDEIASSEKYDLIIIDPPTISRSKKMTQLFDIQVDYVQLIHNSLQLLSKEGTIFFSTNSRKFSFDEKLFPSCSIQDVSNKTIPIDFHDPKIHRCWKISFSNQD